MPTNPRSLLIAELVAKLDTYLREDFEERAGIVEFDACLPRDQAECLALLDVVGRNPFALTGMRALRIGLRGHFHHVITIDEDRTRQKLAQLGYIVSNPLNPNSVLMRDFGGQARLVAL